MTYLKCPAPAPSDIEGRCRYLNFFLNDVARSIVRFHGLGGGGGFGAKLDEIKNSTAHDTLEMSGSRAVWPEVLAIYAAATSALTDAIMAFTVAETPFAAAFAVVAAVLAVARAAWAVIFAAFAVAWAVFCADFMDDSKKELLKEIFWAMNEISSRTETATTTQTVETDDGVPYRALLHILRFSSASNSASCARWSAVKL